MLVLSRKLGQRIVIGSQIELVVTEIRGNQVRLGFVAPRDVSIHRGELLHRIIAEQTGQPMPLADVIAAPCVAVE